MLEPLAILIGAVFNRVRGHGVWTTDFSRAQWAFAMMGVCMWLFGIVPGAITFAAWLMPTFLGRYGAIDVGRNEGSRLEDFGKLSALGLAHTIPAGVLLMIWADAPAWLPLTGLLMGACYELGYRLPSRLPFLRRGPEVGEFLFGAVVGAGLWLASWL
jgi:hypothetical protein